MLSIPLGKVLKEGKPEDSWNPQIEASFSIVANRPSHSLKVVR
jgi:hypothetical protein